MDCSWAVVPWQEQSVVLHVTDKGEAVRDTSCILLTQLYLQRKHNFEFY